MATARDIALTVEEREENQFFWVLIEAADNEAADEIHYARIHSASIPQPSYSSALVMGAQALRKLAGA
jgi:hypothetical protein